MTVVTKKERQRLKEAFLIECIRTTLAKEGKFKKLEREYKPEKWGISDLNKPSFWDRLNTKSTDQPDSPIDIDRLETVRTLIKKRETSVLDIGFGSGRLEKMVSPLDGFKWFGIDISPKSVELARERYPKYKFETGSIHNLTYRDNFFDYVIALEVLEHIRPNKTLRSLREVNRVLKKRGKFIISVPLNEGLDRMLFLGENPNAHLRIYSEELVKAELRISGFKILWSKKLFAFRSLYKLKNFIVKTLVPFLKRPNNIIILAEKK